MSHHFLTTYHDIIKILIYLLTTLLSKPKLSSIVNFAEWFTTNNVANPSYIKYEQESLDYDLIFNNIFSSSQQSIIDIPTFKEILFFYKEIDKLIASRLQEI